MILEYTFRSCSETFLSLVVIRPSRQRRFSQGPRPSFRYQRPLPHLTFLKHRQKEGTINSSRESSLLDFSGDTLDAASVFNAIYAGQTDDGVDADDQGLHIAYHPLLPIDLSAE